MLLDSEPVAVHAGHLADPTERLFWIATMAVAAVFTAVGVVSALSISVIGLILLFPAAMMILTGQKNYRSSSALQRQDCDEAVAVAMRVGVTQTP